jgi:uncharacterized membrane protein YGL010W
MFTGILLIATLMATGIYFLMNTVSLPLWISSLIIFMGAWVGQFVGHGIEGKSRPF